MHNDAWIAVIDCLVNSGTEVCVRLLLHEEERVLLYGMEWAGPGQ
jgi:hypothetical protein